MASVFTVLSSCESSCGSKSKPRFFSWEAVTVATGRLRIKTSHMLEQLSRSPDHNKTSLFVQSNRASLHHPLTFDPYIHWGKKNQEKSYQDGQMSSRYKETVQNVGYGMVRSGGAGGGGCYWEQHKEAGQHWSDWRISPILRAAQTWVEVNVMTVKSSRPVVVFTETAVAALTAEPCSFRAQRKNQGPDSPPWC